MQNIKSNFLVLVSLISIFSFSIVFADNNKGNNVNGEEHRNTIKAVVQKISDVANNEKEVETGKQIKAVANEQDQNKDSVSNIIDEVGNRNWLTTFFVGTDYKNLGQLRSEMVQTRNHISQLNNLLTKVTSDADKKTIQDEIQKLQDEQTKINNFITTNENKFSLFGWVAKLFTSQSVDTVKVVTGSKGQYLTDIKGRTLYYFSKDTSEVKKNMCTGNCATNWPIFYTEEIKVSSPLVASNFGTITTDSGAKQTTYKGWPLYYYYQDAKQGDMIGDGIGDAWYIVKP